MRDFELPGRSPVYAERGMAATSHPLATKAALDILAAGGNAMDAAIAAAALLEVAEPHMTGIGGDCFVLYQRGGEGEVIGYNGSGRAPAAVDADRLAAGRPGAAAIDGTDVHAVTIPGAVEAWARLSADHGRLGLGAVLAPAIDAARRGLPVAPRVARDWAKNEAKLARHSVTAEIYLPGGRAPSPGDRFPRPLLAKTLAAIAERGDRAFYEGPIAADMVETLRALGGVHSLDDFAAHRGAYVQPIGADYRGRRVLQCPPNGQGVIALLILNILSHFDLAALSPDGAARHHLLAEATRLAYAERDAVIADPAVVDVPVDGLLSPGFARALAARIDPDRAIAGAPKPMSIHGPADGDTVYVTVVDEDRNTVSFINSLFHAFGSAITAPQSGVLLNCRGAGFRLEAGHPNRIAPGKRPLHTIIPGMVTVDGRATLGYGVMGGQYQASGHAALLTGLIDYGRDVQAAIDAPRSFHFDGRLALEGRLYDTAAADLIALGQPPTRAADPLGGAQAIEIDHRRGLLIGGSDPRKDGCALGY